MPFWNVLLRMFFSPGVSLLTLPQWSGESVWRHTPQLKLLSPRRTVLQRQMGWCVKREGATGMEALVQSSFSYFWPFQLEHTGSKIQVSVKQYWGKESFLKKQHEANDVDLQKPKSCVIQGFSWCGCSLPESVLFLLSLWPPPSCWNLVETFPVL